MESAEEKLFHLIKTGKPSDAEPVSASPSPDTQNGNQGSSKVGGRMARILSVLKTSRNTSVRWPKIEHVNRAMMLILVALLLGVLAESLRGRPDITVIAEKLSGMAAPPDVAEPVKTLDPISTYVHTARARDIFRPVSSSHEQKPAAPAPAVLPDFEKAKQDLVLVGIYFGMEPVAMIEDTSTRRTHFLKQGERISGMTVNTIERDRVVLEFEGFEHELR